MKHQSEIKERQNDETALTLLKAGERCLKNERLIKYLMIFMSFSVCLAAIFNRYLPQILPSVENIGKIQSTVATYINLVSGVVLVLGIVLGFYVTRMHTEGTVLQDRFEAYVFDNSPNLSILRPIPQTIVEIYARKNRRRSDKKFINSIYGENDFPSPSNAQYEYIKKEVRSDYKLYIYIQPFFLTIWIGFCILIMIIAVSFNDSFITTLINILIPSLSAISIIANSWHNCRLQIKQLQNLQNIIDDIQAMSENKRMLYITDKHNIRLLADGLFAYRASPFVIPNFLRHKYLKSDKSAYSTLNAQTANVQTETAATAAQKHTQLKQSSATTSFGVKTEIHANDIKNKEPKSISKSAKVEEKTLPPDKTEKTPNEGTHKIRFKTNK